MTRESDPKRLFCRLQWNIFRMSVITETGVLFCSSLLFERTHIVGHVN